MKVLIVEDRPYASFYLQELIEGAGYKTYLARNISDANYYVTQDIDCIVLDLNMVPVGLPQELHPETHEYLLSGWVWLQHNVFKNQPVMRDRTIIYSVYIKELKKLVPSDELTDVRLISKRDTASVAKELLKNLRDIEKSLN